jgi:hypothetical protein
LRRAPHDPGGALLRAGGPGRAPGSRSQPGARRKIRAGGPAPDPRHFERSRRRAGRRHSEVHAATAQAAAQARGGTRRRPRNRQAKEYHRAQEKKPPVFRERDINTAKGLTDIAMRRYISDFDRAMNRWTLPLFGVSAEKRALAMYGEDERLQNMSDLNDAGVNASKTDAAAGAYILKESQKTYLRSSDFGWNRGAPK